MTGVIFIVACMISYGIGLAIGSVDRQQANKEKDTHHG